MFCDKCGNQLRDIAKFCNKCGAQVTPVEIVNVAACEPAKAADENPNTIQEPVLQQSVHQHIEPTDNLLSDDWNADDPYAFLRGKSAGKKMSKPTYSSPVDPIAPDAYNDPYTPTRIEDPISQMNVVPSPERYEQQQYENQQDTYADTTAELQNYALPSPDDSYLKFMALSEVIIDEKVSAFRFTNSYKVYDVHGDIVGAIQQQNVSGGAKAARVLLGSSTKAFQKFHYSILDAEGNRLASVTRDGGGFSTIAISDKNNRKCGTFARGKVTDSNNNLICKVKNDLKLWSLTIIDANGFPVATVKKKWNGAAKEFFTTADKYLISVNPAVRGEKRLAIFATALIYDILVHETR